MQLISRIKQSALHGNEKNTIQDICDKYYDHVRVMDNLNNNGKPYPYPYRVHIRTGTIKPELIYELELHGLECAKGSSCNEWETSMQVKHNAGMKIHPPHLAMKLDTPKELQVMAPRWHEFLTNVKFLGHLLGTLENGITVPKQAFGECDTSIVLEIYKRTYGNDYKGRQCNHCIDAELGFKNSIENHNVSEFEGRLRSFIQHFRSEHADDYEKLVTTPSDYLDEEGEVSWSYREDHPNGYLDDPKGD